MPDLIQTIPSTCDSQSWRQAAACRGVERSLMFGRVAIARAICAPCAVAGRCLLEALAEEVDDETRSTCRGGLSGPERHALALGKQKGTDALVRFARLRATVAA